MKNSRLMSNVIVNFVIFILHLTLCAIWSHGWADNFDFAIVRRCNRILCGPLASGRWDRHRWNVCIVQWILLAIQVQQHFYLVNGSVRDWNWHEGGRMEGFNEFYIVIFYVCHVSTMGISFRLDFIDMWNVIKSSLLFGRLELDYVRRKFIFFAREREKKQKDEFHVKSTLLCIGKIMVSIFR